MCGNVVPRQPVTAPGQMNASPRPPFRSTRGDAKACAFEMSDAQHQDLAALLNSVQGMVAFSNYHAPLLEELYPSSKWHKTVLPARTNHASKGKRVEVLWPNYTPYRIR